MVVKKLKGLSQKVRRAQVLLKVDANGPNWTDERIAEAFSYRVQTVEQIRQHLSEASERHLTVQNAKTRRPQNYLLENRKPNHCDWHRPKSQIHNLTPRWLSGDGGGFRLLFSLFTRNGSGQRYLEQTPEVIAAPLQLQVLIWAAAFSLTSLKHASVPV